MKTEIETLGTALPKEIARCEELLTIYADLGPVGAFGQAMIKAELKLAHEAMIACDCVAMVRAYHALKGCK